MMLIKLLSVKSGMTLRRCEAALQGHDVTEHICVVDELTWTSYLGYFFFYSQIYLLDSLRDLRSLKQVLSPSCEKNFKGKLKL